MEFSILMPVYNAEKYLADSAGTVLKQDFSDYELLLADDGSADNSAALCDAFAAAHPGKVRALHLPHRGLIATRRDALKAAAGEFVIWLDADDRLEPGMLKKLHELRNTFEDPDIILYEFTAFFEDGRPDDRRPPLFEDGTLFEGEEGKKPLYERLVRGNSLNAMWSKAMRTALCQADPTDYVPYQENPFGEDALQSLYPMTAAKKILYTSQPFYRYRIQADSIMHRFNKDKLDQRFNTALIGFYDPYLKQWGMDDPEHRLLLRSSYYRGVLDGILYFLTEKGYDQKEVKAYARSFVRAHPEVKKLCRFSALSVRQRGIFALFAAGQLELLRAAVLAKRKWNGRRPAAGR